MANKRIKDLTERTTLAAGDYLATDNDNGTRKVNASKILTAISTAQSTADNVATKVSNSGDAFSSSKGYSVGELCIYNNKVYRCKTAYSTGASWSSRSSNFEQVTLTDAITDLNNDFNEEIIYDNTTDKNITITHNKAKTSISFYFPLQNPTNAQTAYGFSYIIPQKYRPSTPKYVMMGVTTTGSDLIIYDTALVKINTDGTMSVSYSNSHTGAAWRLVGTVSY